MSRSRKGDKDDKIEYVGSEGLGDTSNERIKNLKKCKPKTLKLEVENKHLLREFDELPFFYVDGEEGHIFWMCNYDKDGKITSVYQNTRILDCNATSENPKRLVAYLDDISDAINIRNDLVRMGWMEGQLPRIEANQKDWNAMPRQQKKRIIRQLHKQAIKEERNDERKSRLKKQIKNVNKLIGKNEPPEPEEED